MYDIYIYNIMRYFFSHLFRTCFSILSEKKIFVINFPISANILKHSLPLLHPTTNHPLMTKIP